MKALTRILCIGSPFGDDRLGWVAAEAIRESAWYCSLASGSVDVESFDRPGPAFLAAMEGASHAVLLDAMRSGSPPGTLRRVAVDEFAPSADNFTSGHSVGLADTLLLGKVLGLLPSRLTLFAVEVGCVRSDDSLSAEVRAALPALLECVAACVTNEDGMLGTAAAA